MTNKGLIRWRSKATKIGYELRTRRGVAPPNPANGEAALDQQLIPHPIAEPAVQLEIQEEEAGDRVILDPPRIFPVE